MSIQAWEARPACGTYRVPGKAESTLEEQRAEGPGSEIWESIQQASPSFLVCQTVGTQASVLPALAAMIK